MAQDDNGGLTLGWQYYAFGGPFHDVYFRAGTGDLVRLQTHGEFVVFPGGVTTSTRGFQNAIDDPDPAARPIVAFDILADDTSITFRYGFTEFVGTWVPSQLSLAPTIHNGIAIDLLSGGTFQSVTIDPATNMVGFDSSRISFTSNEIQVDWQNLSFDSTTLDSPTIVKLDINVGNVGSLFTIGADSVNFNSLTDAQKAALAAGGVDRYNALDGDDIVDLPNVSTFVPGGYSETNTFSAGPGNDIITGGDRDDKIDGGPGNDIILGGAGNNTITGGDGDDDIGGGDGNDTIVGSPGWDDLGGGDGTDTFDYQTQGFIGFATGTQQTISGGSNDDQPDGKDIIKLPGSPNDYTFTTTLGNNWQSTQTTIRNVPLGYTFITSDVEKAHFASPLSNTVSLIAAQSGANRIAEAAELMVEAYPESTMLPESTVLAVARNWHPVAGMELGMQASDFGDHSKYTFLDTGNFADVMSAD
jgi:Ca2+-binding RTX toxin-like protein